MMTVRVESPESATALFYEGSTIQTWTVVADNPGLPAALAASPFKDDVAQFTMADFTRKDVPGYKWESPDGKTGGVSWTRYIIYVDRSPDMRDVLIVTDGPAYIMNSQGQTVERILGVSFSAQKRIDALAERDQ